jgi:hypothetical protein
MFCFFYRKNDRVKVQLKRDQYIVIQLIVKKIETIFAIRNTKLYILNQKKEWEKIDAEDPFVKLVEIMVEKGWTVWKYQQEMLEKMVFDWHHGKKAEWLFPNENFDIMRVELHHKNVILFYNNGEIKNFSFSKEELKSFSDYDKIKNTPIIKIKNGIRIPIRDI